MTAVFDAKVYGWLIQAMRNVHGQEAFEVRAPILWPGMAEESFNLNFYGKVARLATSNAFYLLLMASKYGNCYLIQKSFRQEPRCSVCHLNEFDLYECCLCDVDFAKLLDTTERVLRDIHAEAKRLFPMLCSADMPETPFKRYEWKDLDAQIKNFSKIDFKTSPDIQIHQFLSTQTEPFFITNMPRKQTSSWLVKCDPNGNLCTFDLILPGVGEVFEGSERPMQKDIYEEKLLKGANLAKSFKWFLDGFEDQKHPISMFGCGIERLAMWLFGIKDIADIHQPYRKNCFSELL